MRTSQTARLAAAIALALAGQAYAATAVKASSTGTSATTAGTTSSGTAITGTNGTLIRSSTAIQTPANTSTTTTTGTTTNNGNSTFTQPQNATNVDVRDQQTQEAVAGTHSSGSTSALSPLATGNASVNSPTTAGTGTTSGLGATGTGSSTGTATTGTTTGAAVGTTGVGTVNGFPAVGGAGVVGTNGVVVIPSGASSDFTSGLAATQGNTILANGIATNDVVAGSVLVPEATSAANGASVNRAINQVSRDRKRVGRNGQLLYSIAPRTSGVDRSNEMPDDGPSPALTGSNSTLTR